MVIIPTFDLQCIVQAQNCKFYVWWSDPKERVCIDVPYDKVFLNETISNARQFYF